MEELFSMGPMVWVYTAIFGAVIWGVWGQTEDDIMF